MRGYASREMTDAHNADELAAQVADAVRRAVADATTRAEEIVMEAEADANQIRARAEAEAAQIRERAEADAREQINAAKRALDELGGSLAAAVEAATPKDPAMEEPVTPPAPEQPTVEQTAPRGNGDDAAERLVAMKLAVDGKDRAEIEAELTAKFGAADRSGLLDDVLSRVPR
jgi:cell division septum initiation protein DivIVA